MSKTVTMEGNFSYERATHQSHQRQEKILWSKLIGAYFLQRGELVM